ncbi:MAG TPA: sigma-54 dependent transcriptional regulator [Prolixibacteraceae bacterium]|nr:sigma-54 dependent transcriptional regulator [Prolixibacteraceae bacterium]
MEKILIIDDDRLNLMVLKEIINKAGYIVIEAENGETGLQLVHTEHPDLVITDFQMPGMNGIEVLSQIQELNIGLPVILLTGFGDVVLTIKSIQLGAFDFLEKPVDPNQLKTVIRLALNSVKVSLKLNKVLKLDMPSANMLEDNILVGKNPKMKEIFKNIGRISLNKVNVLIQGETGTGKELIARLIHYSGITINKPLVIVNCSALTETLLESELFGHVKGSFTGSVRDKKGKFELAGEGTIFLDEISEISLNTQVKLLRVIQELEFERVGGEEVIPMKARIISATNKSLENLIQEGKFREDLYYRLKVFTINLPPLRERKDDIRDLVIHFLHKLNKRFNKNVVKIEEGVIEMLQVHDWLGNVRELENTILQAIVMSKSDVLEMRNITLNTRGYTDVPVLTQEIQFRSLAEMEKYQIKRILDEVNWNKLEASRILDITRPTLNAKIEKYKLVKD